MKNILIALTLIVSSCFYSQEVKTDKEFALDGISALFDSYRSEDIEGVLELTYPRLFELLPEVDFKPHFKKMLFGNNEYSVAYEKVNPSFSISEKHENKNETYFFISYVNKLKMTYKKMFEKEEQTEILKIINSEFIKARFTDDYTLFVSQKNAINIAIKDSFTNQKWRYINYDEDNPFFNSILSEAIKKEAKQYKTNLNNTLKAIE